ncbi:hypothetical protein KCU65_g7092, partial [Aureobasidium melanogenum]
MPSPIASSSSTYPCFFCNFELATVNELASHLIVSHGSDLHTILCPKAGDEGLRDEISGFLNQFAMTGDSFVRLCGCFPGHWVHDTTTPAAMKILDWTETDETDTASDEIADSGLGSPMSTSADGLDLDGKSDLFALPGGSDLSSADPATSGPSSTDPDGRSTSAASDDNSTPISNITPKITEFLVSVGLTPTRTTSGKRVYLRPYMP